MDAATAAILASSITGAVALGVSWLNPHLTAKRARETELLKMRRDAYVSAIRQVDLFSEDDSPDGLRQVAVGMFGPSAQLELLGSPDVAALYRSIHRELMKLADRAVKDEDTDDDFERLVGSLRLFIETARAHMGVDDLEG